MSKGVKKILGVVAAVAIPFVAAPVAGMLASSGALGTAATSFLGTSAGVGVTGAVLGGAASALSGGDPLTGAVMGGLGGYTASGGLDRLFGAPAASSTNAVSGPMSSSLRPVTRPGGLSAPTATTSTGTAVGQKALQSAISGLTDPATLARITLLAATGDMTGLSPVEEKLVRLRRKELEQAAATNQELFDTQLREAQNFMQMAAQNAPNPQQAFAQTQIAAKRQLAENTRGKGADQAAFETRRAGISSAQAGATAAAAEEERGRRTQAQLMQTGLSTLPSEAPTGKAGLMMPMYQDLAERGRQAQSDLVYGVTRAAPDLFGGIA